MDQTKIPSFTGNPLYDTIIREGLKVVAGAIATYFIAYLTKHGYSADFVSGVPAMVLFVLIVIVLLMLALWSVINKKTTLQAAINNVVVAAQSGEVSADVKAIASPVQKAAIASAGK